MKKVHFHKNIVVFYYKQTTVEPNVCWQQVARDRCRFHRRISNIELEIGWVFESEHRDRMYDRLYNVNTALMLNLKIVH